MFSRLWKKPRNIPNAEMRSTQISLESFLSSLQNFPPGTLADVLYA